MTTATATPVLDALLEIVDAHHHLGEKYSPPYYLNDLLADTSSGHHVTQTIFVECGWRWRPAGSAFVGLPEIEAVAEVAAESRARGGAQISGIIGYVDLRGGVSAVARDLDEADEAAGDLLVGIRHATAWDPSPDIAPHRTHPGPGLLANETFQQGLEELGRRELVYDAWLYHPQLPELEAVAARVPNTKIVLDHLGGPLGIGPYAPGEIDDEWLRSMGALARHDNVFVKLAGIGMPHLVMSPPQSVPARADQLTALWSDRIRRCIDLFGPSRCMFASDFPPDRTTCSYSTIWTTFKMITKDFSDSERAALFHGTARDVYDIPAVARLVDVRTQRPEALR